MKFKVSHIETSDSLVGQDKVITCITLSHKLANDRDPNPWLEPIKVRYFGDSVHTVNQEFELPFEDLIKPAK